jgi:pilus assembly protein TadC
VLVESLDGVFVDYLVIFFALVFYAFLIVVYLLRAHQSEEMEWKLSLPFSLQLIPFALLWVVNLIIGNDSGRLVVELPIIIYLVYDLWYRLITQKKPYHHPERWPIGLIIYLLLLFIGSIGLNWYGYLVSSLYGNMLVVSFFIMMSSYGYYQYTYKKSKKAK